MLLLLPSILQWPSFNGPWPLALGVELFTIGQHGDELGDLPGTGFRLFDVLNSEKDGVPVLAIERGKECPGLLVGMEGPLQVIRDG